MSSGSGRQGIGQWGKNPAKGNRMISFQVSRELYDQIEEARKNSFYAEEKQVSSFVRSIVSEHVKKLKQKSGKK